MFCCNKVLNNTSPYHTGHDTLNQNFPTSIHNNTTRSFVSYNYRAICQPLECVVLSNNCTILLRLFRNPNTLWKAQRNPKNSSYGTWRNRKKAYLTRANMKMYSFNYPIQTRLPNLIEGAAQREQGRNDSVNQHLCRTLIWMSQLTQCDDFPLNRKFRRNPLFNQCQPTFFLLLSEYHPQLLPFCEIISLSDKSRSLILNPISLSSPQQYNYILCIYLVAVEEK